MRVDLYTNPHKEQREWLYKIAIQAGKIDYASNKLVSELFLDFDNLIAELQQHVRAEENFVAPLYALKAPDLISPLHADHEKIEVLLASLCLQVDLIRKEQHVAKRGEYGCGFYRTFNRFIAEYLEHIDAEERTLPFLWECYNDKQLLATIMTYKASIGSDEAMDSILAELPSYDTITQKRLFLGFKNNATSERFLVFRDKLHSKVSESD